MSETAKIKLNDRPENAEKPNEKVELPIVDNDKKADTAKAVAAADTFFGKAGHLKSFAKFSGALFCFQGK
ncbi:TPA: hypothetical protein ACFI49_001775 [Neisseria gonorrhoeae]